MTLGDPEHGVAGVLIAQALQGKPLTLYGGDQVRDFNFVDDVVDALLRAGQADNLCGESFNLGAIRPCTLRQFAETLGRIIPVSLQIEPLPAERRAIDVGDLICDFTRFQQATGWQPVTDLETGLKATLRFFREQHSSTV
jgi:nucleoside-diphosphate-sugar epimerase